MKSSKIGDIELKVAETTADISAVRFFHFKVYLVQDESGLSLPSLKETWKGFIAEFDRDSKAGMFIKMNNFMNGLNKLDEMEDPCHMMYALLTLEEGESPINVDPTFLKDKLKRLYDAGISQGEMEGVVYAFLEGLSKR